MDNWYDRDNSFENDEGIYDDSWLKPCVDEWRSIHPAEYNPYDSKPWGTWSNNNEDS